MTEAAQDVVTQEAEEQKASSADAAIPAAGEPEPAPASPDSLDERADRIIEAAARTSLERGASIVDARTAQGVEVQRGEVFPWKGALWRVAGTTQVIETDDQETPTGAVVVVPVRIIGRGWRRSEKLSRKARKRALERPATARLVQEVKK